MTTVNKLMESLLTEGILRAQVGQVGTVVGNMPQSIAALAKNSQGKLKMTLDEADDLEKWLVRAKADYPDLKLKMGEFKTWLKTSEAFVWRYYFVLNDSVFSKIISDIKSNQASDMEKLADLSLTKRAVAADLLDSAKDIDGLIHIVKVYQSRAKQLGELMLTKHVKNTPFVILHAGVMDLEHAVKKIVRLAI